MDDRMANVRGRWMVDFGMVEKFKNVDKEQNMKYEI